MADRREYITMQEAAKRLGVNRVTLYYYIEHYGMETPKKFPLDKNKYVKIADVERIKQLRDEATERAQQDEEVPA